MIAAPKSINKIDFILKAKDGNEKQLKIIAMGNINKALGFVMVARPMRPPATIHFQIARPDLVSSLICKRKKTIRELRNKTRASGS
jgi:hypothetical protein